jgi:hypothetical protein
VKENINKPTSEVTSNEDELQEEDAKAQSDTTSISESKCEAHHQVQHDLSKPIIRPWEELHFNRNRHGLGYENQNSFHIPNYSKPILFVSVGFLQENSTSPVQVQHQNDKCKHCNRVGHMENQCFDLHPCQHCGKHNHSSDRCSTLKKPARLKIHYEWIDPWKWSSTTKRLYKSYRRIQSRVKTNLVSHNIFVPHISGPLMA